MQQYGRLKRVNTTLDLWSARGTRAEADDQWWPRRPVSNDHMVQLIARTRTLVMSELCNQVNLMPDLADIVWGYY